jgi:hypothetical protein
VAKSLSLITEPMSCSAVTGIGRQWQSWWIGISSPVE